jgi:hypothetical protein
VLSPPSALNQSIRSLISSLLRLLLSGRRYNSSLMAKT